MKTGVGDARLGWKSAEWSVIMPSPPPAGPGTGLESTTEQGRGVQL